MATYPSFFCGLGIKNNMGDFNLTYVPNMTINSVTLAPSGTYPLNSDKQGTATTNGINYNVYTFTNTTATVTSYTINYTALQSTVCYVLAVGGGGGGSSFAGGGGGGGEVVMTPVSINPGTKTITIAVGAGGTGSAGNGYAGSSGIGANTTVTFSDASASYLTITAYGGGCGGGGNTASGVPTAGGNGGGSAGSGYQGGGASGNPYFNTPFMYGNPGGISPSGSYGAGGGGSGSSTITAVSSAAAGNGKKCLLPGIKDFSPSGTSYGTYYWGGGGGGSNAVANTSSAGGIGGGGGGAQTNTTGTVSGGSSAINSGANGAYSNGAGGAGGANTGGGGGGGWNGAGGNGGSGIVIIAFPAATTSIPNTLFFSPLYIPGCMLWLDSTDASTITKTATNQVTQWNDKSEYANNFTQSTILNYPYTNTSSANGLNIMDFSGNVNMSNSSLYLSTTYSIFTVGYTTVNDTNYRALAQGKNNYNLLMGINSGNYITYVGNGSSAWNDQTVNTSTNTLTSQGSVNYGSTPVSIYNSSKIPYIMSMTISNRNTGLNSFYNGTPMCAKNGAVAASTGLTLSSTTSTTCWNGYIGEVIIYNGVLTYPQRFMVEGYLAQKWGIQSTLATSNPYLTILPPLVPSAPPSLPTPATGIFSTVWVNGAYTGPIFNLRRSSDSSTNNFYVNSNGSMIGTQPNGAGIPLTTWMGTGTVYVATWYDQSGLGNNATQTNTGLQPLYNVTGGYVDFNSTSYYFNLPNGTIPYSGNYTVSCYHNTIYNTGTSGICGCGVNGNGNQTNCFRIIYGNPSQYSNYWYGNDFNAGYLVQGGVVTWIYDGTNRNVYMNGMLLNSAAPGAGWNGQNVNHFLGKTPGNEMFNGQMYYAYFFNSALNSTQRAAMGGI